MPSYKTGTSADRVERFNQQAPVGTVVHYHPLMGSAAYVETKVRGAAYVLGGHTPVCFVENVAGAVALDAIEIPTEQKETK